MVVLVGAWPTAAVADTICPIQGCEANHEASCNDVCSDVTVGGKTIVVCNLDVTESGDLGATGFAVYDPSDPDIDACDNGQPYCAWGKTSAGAEFYCDWDTFSDTLTEVHLIGGDGDDYLSFLCEEGTNPPDRVQLQEWDGYDLTAQFIGRMTAGAGDDELVGSRRISEDYEDNLSGQGGSDDIASHEGDDYIDSGGHGDVVCAGPGDDGVFTAGGADIVCAEEGDDNVVAGTENDSVDAGDGTNVVDGGGGTDQCENADTHSNCEGFVATQDCLAICPP